MKLYIIITNGTICTEAERWWMQRSVLNIYARGWVGGGGGGWVYGGGGGEGGGAHLNDEPEHFVSKQNKNANAECQVDSIK